MKEEDLKNTIDNIKTKLGEENSALISDDLGILITKNTEIQKEIKTKDEEISGLNDKVNKLVLANSSLLQQIPMGDDPTTSKSKKEDDDKPFSYKSLFDKKGNFIK